MLLIPCLIFVVLFSVSTGNNGRLRQYKVQTGNISVSGFSSGAAFSTQFHVAHSSKIVGFGSIAGIPYHCASGNITTALDACLKTPAGINVDTLLTYARTKASTGGVDPISSMSSDKVFIYSGTLDTTVVPGLSYKMEEFYNSVVSPGNIKTVYDMQAAHTFPTDNYGGSCTSASSPYISNCGYNAAYDLLSHIYGGGLVKPATSGVTLQGQLLSFDQTEFPSVNLPGIVSPSSSNSSGLDSTGFVYIPSGCANGLAACKLHVAFHGCRMFRLAINDIFARHAGYNEVGELNNIIILYPQVTPNIESNPDGCWDFWGYTDSGNYDLKTGAQISAVDSMITRITG